MELTREGKIWIDGRHVCVSKRSEPTAIESKSIVCNENEMKYWNGLDFYGSGITSHKGVKSLQDCADFCFADSKCVAFTYAKDPVIIDGQQVHQYCLTKKAGEMRVSADNYQFISGHKCDYVFLPLTGSEAPPSEPTGIIRPPITKIHSK